MQDKDPALGLLGPTLRAKVGDTIRIHYRNNVRFTTSLHPHGVLYAKDSEGSPYNDGTSGNPSLGSAGSCHGLISTLRRRTVLNDGV